MKRRSANAQRSHNYYTSQTPTDPVLRGTQSQFTPAAWPSNTVRYSAYEPTLSLLTEVEDGRRFEPTARALSPLPGGPTATGYGTLPRLLSGAPARLKAAPTPATYHSPPPSIAFADPRSTIACIRRQRRREVLHALRKTGKGSKARKRHRNQNSDIRC